MKELRILVQTDDPERVPGIIRGRHPDARITVCTTYDGLADAVAEADPEIAYTMVVERRPYPRQALFGSPGLHWVHASGAGINHLAPWDSARVKVTNAGGMQDESMAQTALARIVAINCNFFAYHDLQKEHRWKPLEALNSVGGTLTVVGLGRIGRACARLAHVMGMRVHGVRARPEPVEGIERVVPPERMHEVLAVSDYVIVVTPLTERTRGLIGTKAFAAMKPGVVVHNMARGGVMDEAALIAALESGHVRAASLDVFAEEPLPASSPLWDVPNLYLTPHVGGMITTDDYERRCADLFLANLDRYLAGKPLENVCDPARGY